MHQLTRLVALLTAVMGFVNVWRFFALLQQRATLVAYGASFRLSVALVMSLFWAILFIVLAYQVWRETSSHVAGRSRSLLLPLVYLVYTVYNLLLASQTLPFLLWHLFLTIFTAATLVAHERANRLPNTRQTNS